jgi:hypothetical protein
VQPAAKTRKPKLHRGQVLRGKRSESSPSVDLIVNLEEFDPEHGRAKALAIMAGVPRDVAIDATRHTVGALIDAKLNPEPSDEPLELQCQRKVERCIREVVMRLDADARATLFSYLRQTVDNFERSLAGEQIVELPPWPHP